MNPNATAFGNFSLSFISFWKLGKAEAPNGETVV
jgi:hypothetical protein